MIKYILKTKLFVLFILLLTQSIYAKGWKQDSVGWKYENSDGSYVKSSYIKRPTDYNCRYDYVIRLKRKTAINEEVD